MPTTSDERRHILVVNDDPAILELFSELLEEAGYQVSLDKFARQTGELLDSIKELRPDLIILDFIIGGESSGWQMLQAAQMDRTTRDIPVIVCTAAVKQVTELSVHLDEMGVHVVLKPFDIDHLLDIVNRVGASQDAPTPGLDTLGASASGGENDQD